MKYLVNFILLLMFVSPLFSQFSGGGKGTKESSYLLKTKQNLMNIRDSFAVGKHYKLCNNIRDSLREPIPKFENSTFDGSGFKITLAIRNYYGCAGLFSEVYSSILRNIVLVG